MSEKILESSTASVPVRTYVNGEEVGTPTPIAKIAVVKSIAERHRPRPKPLSPTRFSFSELRQNIAIYDGRDAAGNGRTGPYLQGLTVFPPYANEQKADSGHAAVVKAIAKMTGRRGTFGESLAEARQTSSMLMKRLKQLYAICEALLRGNRRALERALGHPLTAQQYKSVANRRAAGNALNDAALELKFGWMPLVEDIQNAVKGYLEGLGSRGQAVRTGSGSTGKWGIPRDLDDFNRRAGGAARLHWIIDNEQLANANAFGLLNIPQEVWNKVGLSFVFDWFIPVGTMLAAYTGQAGMTFVYGSRTSMASTMSTAQTKNGGKAIGEYYLSAERWPIMVSPEVPPWIVLWTGGGIDSFSKVITFAQLAYQRFGPRP